VVPVGQVSTPGMLSHTMDACDATAPDAASA